MKSWKGTGILLTICVCVAPWRAYSQTEESTRIFNQNNGGVVALVAYDESKNVGARGTAFALDETIIATNYHLISRAYDAEAITSKGKKLKVEGIIAVAKQFDVVFLRVKGKLQPLAIGNSDDLMERARIFTIGSNDISQITASEGTLLRFLELSPVYRFIEVSLSTPTSFSGSPIFDINGFVMGLVLVMENRLKCVIPLNLFLGLSRSGYVTALKDIVHEDYLSTPEGVYLAGRLAALTGDLKNARMYLERTVRFNPSLIDAHALLATVCANLKEYAGAAAAFERVIELDDKRADAHHGLGSAHIGMRSFDAAIPPLEKAVALDPGRREAYYDLGTAYEETKNFTKAAESYEKYLSLAPENPWGGYLRLGLCRKELGDYEGAISAFQSAHKLQPKDIKTNFEYADALVLAKQLDKAEEIYKALCTINPEGATTYYGKIIQMYDEAGLYDKAIEGAKKIIEINPSNELAVYNLGIMYLKLEKYDDAKRMFMDCLAIKPDYAQAYYNIGYVSAKQNKTKEAVEAFKKFVELVPDSPDGWLNVGVSYMMLKDFESALEPLRKCVALRPDRADAQYNLAIVYLNLKDNYSAREIYKVLIDLKRSDLAEKLRRLLR